MIRMFCPKRIAHLTMLLMLVWHSRALPGDAYVQDLHARAEGGNIAAQVELGVRYEHGRNVPKDSQKAVEWYCRAAQQGSAEAQYNLGYMFFVGRGVRRDHGVARKWLDAAAKQGDTYAAKMLPRLQRDAKPAVPICPSPASSSWRSPGCGEKCQQIAQRVRNLAPIYGLDAGLVLAVIRTESDFRPDSRSPKNAQGLMQLLPATARRFGVDDPKDPEQNLKGGMAYLQWLLARFQGEVRLALAAYNAGEEAVEHYGGIPPYPETRDYVAKVMAIYSEDAPRRRSQRLVGFADTLRVRAW
jgi:soluble lytic murein transglycosylase-like protein